VPIERQTVVLDGRGSREAGRVSQATPVASVTTIRPSQEKGIRP
jgi:hypothetical protein